MVHIAFPVVMAVFIATPVAAQTFDDEPFPGYAHDCGYPIKIEQTANLSKAQIDADGVARIVIDPKLLQPQQGFHRTFLIAHECAHHRMRHTTRGGLAKRFNAEHGIRDQELSADCWAAETLTKVGMLPALLNIADQFWRRGFVSPGGGYPSGIQRSNVIRHCGRIAVEKMQAARLRIFHPAER